MTQSFRVRTLTAMPEQVEPPGSDLKVCLTDEARRALLRAEQEAKQRNHRSTDVDHVLFALLSEESAARQSLASAGLDPEHMRSLLQEALSIAPRELQQQDPSVEPRVQTLIQRAAADAARRGAELGSLDILIQLLEPEDSGAMSLLHRIGITEPTVIRRGLLDSIQPESTQQTPDSVPQVLLAS